MDQEWWRANGPQVKKRLTLAERNVVPQPGWALSEAEKVLALMEEHGYPDWWSRVTRLQQDAALRADWRW